ncbi:MAG TPA: zinc ribbon domain-containing protein [Steroidobacteraceae bacterium]|nr:zinc ribbon domain-containing protein [Steroidobacteraceae bacterium]
MPFYEYECSSCKYYTEVMQKITDAPLTKCPSCGQKTLKKLLSAPVFRLKGGGWYETDFKSDKESKRNLAGADREEGAKPQSDSKAETKVAAGASEAKADSAKADTAGAGTGSAGGEGGAKASGSAAGAGRSHGSSGSARSPGKGPSRPTQKAPSRPAAKSRSASRPKARPGSARRKGRR